MMKLLIAVDGSPHAHRAIETAGRLAQEMQGLQAVQAREPASQRAAA